MDDATRAELEQIRQMYGGTKPAWFTEHHAFVQVATDVDRLGTIIDEQERENTRLEHLISATPHNNTLLPPEFQRLWESLVRLSDKAEFHNIVRYIGKLEGLLRDARRNAFDEAIEIAKQNRYWGGFLNDQVVKALEVARDAGLKLPADQPRYSPEADGRLKSKRKELAEYKARNDKRRGSEFWEASEKARLAVDDIYRLIAKVDSGLGYFADYLNASHEIDRLNAETFRDAESKGVK